MRRRVALAALGAALASCGIPQFDPPSLVTTVRILAIKADPPEVAPGESTVVTAAVFDPLGAPLLIWSVCTPDPVAGASACADTLSTGGGSVPDPLFGPTITVDIPIDALQGSTDPTALAVASLIVCSGGDPALGGNPLTCFPAESPSDAGPGDAAVSFDMIPDTLEIGIKRITVSDTITPNQNPIVAELTYAIDAATQLPLDESELDCGGGLMANGCIGAGDVVSFAMVAADGSAEDYTVVVDGADEMRTEELIVSFFGTHGHFTSIRAVADPTMGLAATDDWASAPAAGDPGPAAQPGELVRFWFVLRDGRGGTEFVERTLGVVP